MERLLTPLTTSNLEDQDFIRVIRALGECLQYGSVFSVMVPSFSQREVRPHPSLSAAVSALPRVHNLVVKDRTFWQGCHLKMARTRIWGACIPGFRISLCPSPKV